MSFKITVLSLSIDEDSSAPEVYDFDKDKVIIGRSESCDLRIDKPAVSRKHLELSFSEDGSTVTDLGSTNGTVIDNKRLESNKIYPINSSQRMILGENVLIKIESKAVEKVIPVEETRDEKTPSKVIERDEFDDLRGTREFAPEFIQDSMYKEKEKVRKKTEIKSSSFIDRVLNFKKEQPSKIDEPEEVIEEIVPDPSNDYTDYLEKDSFSQAEAVVESEVEPNYDPSIEAKAEETEEKAQEIEEEVTKQEEYAEEAPKNEVEAMVDATKEDKGAIEEEVVKEPVKKPHNFSEKRDEEEVVVGEVSEDSETSFDFIATQFFDIEGEIKHKDKPLEGVSIHAGKFGTTSTDANGRFELKDIEEGSEFKLLASKDKYLIELDKSEGVLDNNKKISGIARELFSIHGQVSHKGKELVDIEVKNHKGDVTKTDSLGYFAFKNIPEGEDYAVDAFSDKYIFEIANSRGVVDGEIDIAIKAKRLYNIRGKVVRAGKPLPGVKISAGEIGATTTELDGTFVFNSINEDTVYQIQPSKKQFEFYPDKLRGEIDKDLEFEFEAKKLFTITGTVIHQGKALENVEIDGGELGIVYTDKEGRYEFKNIPEGTRYTLKASKDGYKFGAKQSVVKESK